MSNYETLITPNAAPILAWVRGVPLEAQATEQLRNVARLPFIHRHVAVMPDVHAGIGATVGSVIPTLGAIIPAAVGVDIGCGMCAVKTSLKANDLPTNLRPIREAIEAAVPHGRTDNGGKRDKGAWHDLPPRVSALWQDHLAKDYSTLCAKYPKLGHGNDVNHLGTLGTGNHFIEVCLDENAQVWFLLHSGSRGVGNRFGEFFIALAREDCKKAEISLPDRDLAYFSEGSEHFDDYVLAVTWAQTYARLNRQIMLENIIAAVAGVSGIPSFTCDTAVVNCHHNYVEQEEHFGVQCWVTRKGAVRAGRGEMGIIPGSMGERSFIVRGKGEAESFCSCSHGAGRLMSRSKAFKTFTVEDHATATAGVECRKDKDVLDETPKAYKDLDAVMAAQSDLVEIVQTLKQVVCVKG